MMEATKSLSRSRLHRIPSFRSESDAEILLTNEHFRFHGAGFLGSAQGPNSQDAASEPRHGAALWSGTNKNGDVSTGPLAHPFARSLAPLTRSLARSLRSLSCSWESEFLRSQDDLVVSHSVTESAFEWPNF